MSGAKRSRHASGTAADIGKVRGPVRLRWAVSADTPAIEEIERTCFADHGAAFGRRRIRSLVKNPKAIVLVACDATGVLLGWAVALDPASQKRRHGAGL